MRLLLIHEEARGVAGAERMLAHFLAGLRQHTEHEVTLAAVPTSRFGQCLPAETRVIPIPEKVRFSAFALKTQLDPILAAHRSSRFDLVHGWAARDWELTSLFRWRAGIPAVGTLHDHPKASFHHRVRQQIMAWSARLGLNRIVCVSDAVREACIQAGYSRAKLKVVHNGLPLLKEDGLRRQPAQTAKLGFLGVFAPRKGLRELFALMDELARRTPKSWRLVMAGGTQDEEGNALITEIQKKFSNSRWWHQVEWLGWIENAHEFLNSIDMLIVPSAEFDPFPTVLLEAGQARLPVLAANVGGVPEIVAHGETGWLFDPKRVPETAEVLAALLDQPELLVSAGRRAADRIAREFSVGKMVASYDGVYSTLRTE